MYYKVLGQYLKNLMLLKSDYEQLLHKGISARVFSVDFSEIFLYMFDTRTRRSDFQLVKYLFQENLSRDFRYTLLPPVIFELRMYYERLRRITRKYRFSTKLVHSKELKKLYVLFNKLLKSDERIDISAPEYQEILALWKAVVSKLTSFDFVLGIATEYGSRYLLDQAHQRLVDLLRSGVMIHPQDIDEVSGKVADISSDEEIFWRIFKHLSSRRSRIKDYMSNLVDAEHAAIDFKMNKSFCNSQVMNVFTGSPEVLEAFERHLRLSSKTQPLVRSPIYMMIRTFCSNELKDSFYDPMVFLEAGIDVCADLLRKPNDSNLLAELRKRLERFPNASMVETLYMKAAHYQTLFDIFRLSGRFNDYFYDALRSHYFHRGFSRKLLDRYYGGKVEDLAIMETVEISSRLLEDQELFEDKLAKVEEKIFKNLRHLYRSYIEMLEGFDFTKLSPLMKEHYDFILCEPDEEMRYDE